jgi:hypothetical protein
MTSTPELGNGGADVLSSHSSSKRQRLHTHVAFFAVPPEMVDALHLLHNICSSCIGAHDVQVNELGIYNAFGLIDIVSEHLQAAPNNESYLGEYVLMKEIDSWDCPHSQTVSALCDAIVFNCPLSQIERTLKLMLKSSSKGESRGSAVALHQAFSAACSIIPYAAFSTIVKSPDFVQMRNRIISDHDHVLLQAVRLRTQRHRRSNCALRAIAALSSIKVSMYMNSFQFGISGISSVLRDVISRFPFVSSQPIDPFGLLPCSGCLDISKQIDTASHYAHSMLFCVWRLVRKCCSLLWSSFEPDSLSSMDRCARHAGYNALNVLCDALVALVSVSDDDRRLLQLIKEMEQFVASVSSASRLVLVSLSAQLLHHQKKRLSHECLQLLLSLTPPSPFSSLPVCGHVIIDRAVTFLTNHMNKVGVSLRGSDIDGVTASADWTANEAAISQVIDASFMPVIAEHSIDLPIYHIFDSHLRNAAAPVLSQLPLGHFWKFEPILMNPTLFTSLSLQFRCVYLQKYSLVSHLCQSKSLQRQADLLKPESIFRLAEIVIMLLRSMPANSSLWLHKLAADLGNPGLGAPVVRYFDIFTFRLLPLVLRSNCSLTLLSIVSSRMKVLLSNIQSQQFPLHFRVLNDFVVAMAQCMSESFELSDDIWEMLPETSCRIIIRCMSLVSECTRKSAAPKIICSVTSHLRRLSTQTRMRDWNVSFWGRSSTQLCEPFCSAFRADRKIFIEDFNVVSAEEELLKALNNSVLSSPQRVIHWLREKKHSVLKLKNLFICFWDMIIRNPEAPSLVFFENMVWRDSLITWVYSLSSATECSQAGFFLISYVASKTARSAHSLSRESLMTARALDFLVWETSFAPFHDIIVAICDCDHESSIDWLLHLLRPGCRLEQACLAYASVIFAGSRPCSAFEQNPMFTRRGAPDNWMLPNHRAALDAADECMPAHTPVPDFAVISATYRLFYSWPACALPAIIHVIITLIQREMWNECAVLCNRYRYLFLCCSTPIATSRRLLAASLNRRAPFETCIAILGLAWGMSPSLPCNMPSILDLAKNGDVSSLVCFAVDCVQPLLQHSRDDDSLIAAAFGHAEHLCMMREHLDPRTCTAAVGSMMFFLAYSVDKLSWHRLLLSEAVDTTSIGFLIASLPASCAAVAVGDLLSPGQPLNELAVHVCTVLMAPTMSMVLAQRIITLATVQLHCAISTNSSQGVLMSTRLITCIPLDLHCEVAISELFWSFFSSFVDGCSRWQLPDSPTSTFCGTMSSRADIDDALAFGSRAITSKRFGEALGIQFHCTPSHCNASHASHVSAVLALHPDLGLAYDLFCSVIIDAGKIRKYSVSLFASISVVAKMLFQLLAADLKPGAV